MTPRDFPKNKNKSGDVWKLGTFGLTAGIQLRFLVAVGGVLAL